MHGHNTSNASGMNMFPDVRAALGAGADTAEDLVALALAVASAIQEEEPLDPETRQRALEATARMLRDHADRLTGVFDYLWLQEQSRERTI